MVSVAKAFPGEVEIGSPSGYGPGWSGAWISLTLHAVENTTNDVVHCPVGQGSDHLPGNLVVDRFNPAFTLPRIAGFERCSGIGWLLLFRENRALLLDAATGRARGLSVFSCESGRDTVYSVLKMHRRGVPQ